LCALRRKGLTAPLVIDGAINGEMFLAWVEQFLAPVLRRNAPIEVSLGTYGARIARTAAAR
jgi:hypothetical protein